MKYIYLLRIHHWSKNLFVLVPAFFAGTILHEEVMIALAQGFLCFCFVASGIYILNDYRDRESDSQHPQKKNRPLAAGKVPIPLALGLMAGLMIVGVVWSFFLDTVFGYCVLFYLVNNILYSMGLKNIAILDTIIVSSGFLVRALAGGWLIHVEISEWLVIMVFLLSFFLAMAKRRNDLVLFQEGQAPLRKSSQHYTIEFLNTMLSVLAGVIIVSYLMYTISDEVVNRLGSRNIYITSLFVFAGLMRFLQITMVEKRSGSPTRIFLTDLFIQVAVAGWIACFGILIYFS
ncbi:MAG: decaprenyl-phosphate phosphoribosyltransferase [Bacteroidota bacterium]